MLIGILGIIIFFVLVSMVMYGINGYNLTLGLITFLMYVALEYLDIERRLSFGRKY